MYKAIGFLSEMKVLVKLLEMNFVVSKPQGDYSPYDLISDWKGKLNRIQVKSTSRKSGNRNKGYKAMACKGNSPKIMLTKKDCDFLIIFCFDMYYIIPIKEINTMSFYVHPEFLISNTKIFKKKHAYYYEQFRQKWDFLK